MVNKKGRVMILLLTAILLLIGCKTYQNWNTDDTFQYEAVNREEIIEVINQNINSYRLTLVNKENPVKEGFNEEALVMSKVNRSRYEIKLEAETARALETMFNDAAKDNIKLQLVSGYRNYEEQEKLYSQDTVYTAKPGHSEHHTGLACDILKLGKSSPKTFEGTKEEKWLRKNAYKYGFIQRYPKIKENITGYPYESWHYRYVGTDAARIITKTGITLEEFLSYK
jgi:zinc D-Ala-D-Ala carboxypeptidase